MMNLYIPVQKVDASQRLVYGVLAIETEDKVGEVMDYEGSKPYFEAWSNEIFEASGGKSYGNVRAMHTKVSAGILTQPLGFDDDAKTISVCAHVNDDDEWEKVEAGNYTGFSVGGRYVKRWNDNGAAKYIIAPFECSLVDNPCIPGAYFQVIKMDGAIENRPFLSNQETTPVFITNEMVVERAQQLAKEASGDATKFADYVAAARDQLEKEAAAKDEKPAATTEEGAKAPEDEEGKAAEGEKKAEDDSEKKADGEKAADARNLVAQKWVTPDGQVFDKKADAVAHVEKSASPVAATLAKIDDVLADVRNTITKAAKKDEEPKADADAKDEGDDKKKKKKDGEKATVALVEKSLYDVSRMVCIIEDLNWLQQSLASEAAWEGDNSPLPAKVKAAIAGLVAVLKELVDEETSELFDAAESEAFAAILELSVGGNRRAANIVEKFVADSDKFKQFVPMLQKAGARHSKADQERVQGMHDTAVELGAMCGGADKHAHGTVEKMAADGDAIKTLTAEVETLKAEKAAYEGGLTKALEAIKDLGEEVKKLANSPAAPPPPVNVHVVEKNADLELANKSAELLKTMSPDVLATAAIGLMQRGGGQQLWRR